MSDTHNILFEVFKTTPDHFNWDKHIEYASRYEDIEEEKKRKWINALYFLKQELGNSFLRTSDKNHPLFRRITEKAPWRTSDLIIFTETLQQLKNSDSNYLKLIGKMGSPEKCEKEGIRFCRNSSNVSEGRF